MIACEKNLRHLRRRLLVDEDGDAADAALLFGEPSQADFLEERAVLRRVEHEETRHLFTHQG